MTDVSPGQISAEMAVRSNYAVSGTVIFNRLSETLGAEKLASFTSWA